MKKYLTCLVTIMCFVQLYAQPVLYSVTQQGGNENSGAIIKYDAATNLLTAVQSFESIEQHPYGSLLKAADGKFYGMTNTGGSAGQGTIFSFDPATQTKVKLLDFNGVNGLRPQGSLMQANNGLLYGMTYGGGSFGNGVLFSFNPATNSYVRLIDFDWTNKGAFPFGNLIQAGNGKLYGMTSTGGNTSNGVIFSFDPADNTFTVVKNFDGTNGAHPYGSLLQASDDKLYGMTLLSNINSGVLFSFDPANNSYLNLGYLPAGVNPHGSLIQASNGKLYGLTANGGTGNNGFIIAFDPATKYFDFVDAFAGNGSKGSGPWADLIQAGDGKLYGTTNGGGSSGNGVIFSFDPTAIPFVNGYTKVKDFNGADGARPYGSFIQASNGKFYGMTLDGGTSNNGVIFSFDPATNAYSKAKDLGTNASGNYPAGSLVRGSDGRFYGMTTNGGSGGVGVLYSFDPANSTYAIMHNFDGSDGANPNGSLIKGANGKLYGMTTNGGGTNNGVIFSFDPVTAAYTKLKDFDGTNGANPYGSLLKASDGNLYGMTNSGGSSGIGTIFSYEPVNNSFSKLKDFGGTDGSNPYGSLVQANNGKLYGMTFGGGNSGYGVFFSLDPATKEYMKLNDFEERVNGANPYGSLIQASDGKLYGMTKGYAVGSEVFSYDPANNAFSVVQSFDETSETRPDGDLLQASDGKLYGMTSLGGSNNVGVVFSFDPANTTYAKLVDFDGTNGASPYINSAFVEYDPASIDVSLTANAISCNGGVTTLTITATGGAPPYKYSLDGNTYQTGNTFTVSAGNYTVTVKDSKETTGYNLIAISQPAKLSVTTSVTNASCTGGSGGKITITATGGTSPYLYQLRSGNFQSANVFANLAPGNYTVTVKDNNACAVQSNVINVSMPLTQTFYADADGDGYGNRNKAMQACTAPPGYVSNNTDCDDTRASVHPGATEIADGLDNNCNGTIDEGFITLSIADVSMYEGNKGKSNMTFTVSLSKAATNKITVQYATQNATAMAGSDYMSASGTLTFKPGTTKQTISIAIIGDKIAEPNETFKINLSKAVNVTIAVPNAAGTILNDDGSCKVSSASPETYTNADGRLAEVLPNEDERSVKVYPNPANSKLFVDVSGFTGNITLQLINAAGNVLRQEKMRSNGLKQAQKQIDVSGMAGGTYFLTLIDEQGNRKTEKVIIAR